ncbi:FG-GAP-like repeat-containing protein [Streptomyces anulatus]|uniref:FG-GAP-like repeat-containing protein n=1 Tax=Streptomyces anulatus TaxID=1892 RepID=UPI003659CFE4
MPVPTQELKLEIVNAATGQPLGAKATPAADGTLVVRDYPKDGPRPELWQFTPVPGSQDDPAYVIRNTAGGKALDTPPAAGQGVRQSDASGKKGQQWRLVPVAGEAGLYFIEDAADGAVLDLDEPGKDDTRIVLGEYDDLAESQRWRFVPAEPERTSDLVLDWAPLSHWNSRQSWRLTHHKSALRPAPDATPSFSNVLLVLEKYVSDQDAAGWKNDAVTPSPAGEPGRWAGVGARFLADTEGTGRADIVGIRSTKGAVTSSSRGDGTFDDERPLHQGVATPNPADLWSVVDLTGNGRPDVVALCTGGVRVSAQGEDGAFTPEGGELVLKAFGHGKQAGGWLVDKHPRFLADTTGDGRLDIIGCHDDGLWVSLQDEEGAFAEPLYVLDDFGVDQGWNSTSEHPRFLVTTTRDGVPDIVGFGPHGVVVARGRGDGTFEPAQLVLNDFGQDQGWTGEKHPRLLADVTGDKIPDIIGFGNEGVWVSHNNGDGTFEQAQLVCRGFGYNEDAGGWRVDRHPRFLADITGDGRVDIVGFGGPGVHVARNLHRRFRTR